MKGGFKVVAFALAAVSVSAATFLAIEKSNQPEKEAAPVFDQDESSHESPEAVRMAQLRKARANSRAEQTPRRNTSSTDRDRSALDLHLEGFLAFDPISTERIQVIAAEAEAGNPEGQYSVAKLLDVCKKTHSERYENRTERDRYLAEALRSSSNQEFAAEFTASMKSESDACFDLRDALGDSRRTPEEWMLISAEGGYGPALAAMAGAYAWGAPVPDVESIREEYERQDMRHTLVAAAVRTRNPEALFAVSGFFGRMGPMNRGKPGEDLAWVYAACHFGLECGPENWMLQWMCRWGKDCDQAYAVSLPAYLEYKQYSPAEQDYAARRAPELIRELEAGDWEALELEIDGDQTVVRALEIAAALQEQAASERELLMGRSASETGNP